MHGFHGKFEFLVGKEICQVAIGAHDVQFNWGDGGISATNQFRYRPSNTGEELLWNGEGGDVEVAARTLRILKVTIADVGVTPTVLTLTFSNGDQIDLIDSDKYESVTITNSKDLIVV